MYISDYNITIFLYVSPERIKCVYRNHWLLASGICVSYTDGVSMVRYIIYILMIVGSWGAVDVLNLNLGLVLNI